MNAARDKLKEVFENTVETGLACSNTDSYFSLFSKAAAKDRLFKIKGNNVCMFNCEYEGQDAVKMVFFIPINSEDSGAKNIAERVMEIVECIETCFVTLDSLNSEEVKEDKYIYITAIKKVKEEDI
jgi:hypothetical protein